MFTLSLWEPKRKLIAHQCCNQLTAVKTGHQLTSATWPYRGLKCRPIEAEYFFEVIRRQITSFKWSQAHVYIFQWFISNMLCLCRYGPALLGFWFQTDLGRENSASFFKSTSGEDLILPRSRSTSNFYTLIGQNLTGEFMRKIYAASWKLFTLTEFCVKTCDVFNCLFPLDVQNEIQLLSRVFCYSWLVCLLGFWLRNVSLVKIR